MPFKFSYKALAIAGAGAGFAGRETARAGRPGRQGMAVGLGALGLGVGMMFGAPTIGMAIGTGIANLFFQDKRKQITPPKEKNVLLSPQSLVSSNTVIPLGFGTFQSVGNIFDFKTQRTYHYAQAVGDDPISDDDDSQYFIAIGIALNPTSISKASIGDLPFLDNIVVSQELFKDGGRSRYPDSAQSKYRATLINMAVPGNWDTGWVQVFSSTSYIYLQVTYGVKNVDDAINNIDVYISKKISGEVTVTHLEYADWNQGTAQQIRYYEDVVEGEYKISISTEFYYQDNVFNFYIYIIDNGIPTTPNYGLFYTDLGPLNLTNWNFQCNYLAMKFDNDNFAPENSDFEFLCNQGQTNPITILKSYLTNNEWGLGIPDDKIDTATFDALEATCTTEGRTFNGLFTSQTSPSDIITQFLITAKALMVYSEGKFKLIEDKFSEPTKTFEESNTIVDSFQYTQKDVNAMVSRLKVDFEDSENDYKVRSILLDDLSMIDKIGIKDTSQFLMGVNTETQAADIGAYLFRNLRQPNTATWKVSINDADVEPGDMVEVIRPAMQYGSVFRVVDIQEESNDEIQMSGIAYFPDDEIITITTEDDFRVGSFVECAISRMEDGEVLSVAGYPLPEFIMGMIGLPDVVGGDGDELVELSYTGVVGVCAGTGDYHEELTYSGLVGVTVTF